MVILTGGIDISIGATLSLSGVVCCRLMAENPDVPSVVWILLALLIGIICGAFNGLIVGYFKMVPMSYPWYYVCVPRIFLPLQWRRMVVPASVYGRIPGICDNEDHRCSFYTMDISHRVRSCDHIPGIYEKRAQDLCDRYKQRVITGCGYQRSESHIPCHDDLRYACRSCRNALHGKLCDLQLYDRRLL